MTFRPLNGSDMRSCAVPLMHKYQFLNWSFKEIYARTRIPSTSAHRPKKKKEQKVLSDFRAAVDIFVQHLRANGTFTAALLSHPWMTTPNNHVEEILENPQYLSSLVVYVHAVGGDVSADVLNVLGLPHGRIPVLDLSWLETLLSHCLYTDPEIFAGSETLFKSLRHELLKIGAIEHRKVKLRNPSDHTKLLTTSVTKLKSIEDIVRLESGAQGNDLRCVILTDFIRKAEMPKNVTESCAFEDIGIVPIFESLRRADLANIRLGVLSGSVVLIPAAADTLLREAATTFGVRSGDLSITPLAHDAGYSRVELRGEYYQGMVRLITAVVPRQNSGTFDFHLGNNVTNLSRNSLIFKVARHFGEAQPTENLVLAHYGSRRAHVTCYTAFFP